ncbi:BLUF domain-containing protein [Variovorax sp. RHLX14]|uniref:BLUF domain-containing protein n=1 Tax=Variovorax sp. RHLX14 TaxID=1259731 RepID=UPI003F461230
MLFRIIYCSQSRCTTSEASDLLDHSRINNARLGVTGALYLSGDRFVQCLEGEKAVVGSLYQRISLDCRHTKCRLLDQRPISGRVYSGWSMAWLPESTCAGLLMKTLVSDNDPLKHLDGASMGALFYAMAHTGECR